MRILTRFALLTAFFVAPFVALGQGPELPVAGKSCVTCHGRDGIGKSPGFPNLAGQKSVYMMEQLTMYRDGKRQSDVMNISVEKLTDDDIRAIAEYYEAQPACK